MQPHHVRSIPFTLLLILLVCAACDAEATGPRLVSQNTLDPLPTLLEIQPETDEILPTAPNLSITSERMSPLNVVTIDADFVIVTPTLPPSKTPTKTTTLTTTPPITLTPTITVTSSMTAPTFPTPIFSPTVAVVSNPINQTCLSLWSYIQPPPAGCPLSPATVSCGVYQEFERGRMFWTETPPCDVQDVDNGFIFVLFSDGTWKRFDDSFREGTGNFPDSPWSDPNIVPPMGLFQPERGFGKLWRNEDANPDKEVVRDKVGWGTMEEVPYSFIMQMRSNDGTLFINDSKGGWYQLTAGGQSWQPYAGGTSPYVNPPGSSTLPLP